MLIVIFFISNNNLQKPMSVPNIYFSFSLQFCNNSDAGVRVSNFRLDDFVFCLLPRTARLFMYVKYKNTRNFSQICLNI